MRYFLDLGTHLFEGLEEFTAKLNLGVNDTVYCFEPNKNIYRASRENNRIPQLETRYKKFSHTNAAVMNYTGTIRFNTHNGAWVNGNKEGYMPGYTCGSNCLDINPVCDPDNGVHFNIQHDECDCISIEDIVMSIVSVDADAEIYIKCDIEGSEFVVLPKLLNSQYISHVKEIYIEWHERFWQGREDYEDKVRERKDILAKFDNLNIPNYVHR